MGALRDAMTRGMSSIRSAEAQGAEQSAQSLTKPLAKKRPMQPMRRPQGQSASQSAASRGAMRTAPRTAANSGITLDSAARGIPYGNDAIRPNFGTFGDPVRPPMEQMAEAMPSQYETLQRAEMTPYGGEQRGGAIGGMQSQAAGTLSPQGNQQEGAVQSGNMQLAQVMARSQPRPQMMRRR